MKAFVFKEPNKTRYTCFLIKEGTVMGKVELNLRKSAKDTKLTEKGVQELIGLHNEFEAIEIYHG